jgi:hypothetical protein
MQKFYHNIDPRSFGASSEADRESWIFSLAQSLSVHLENVDTSECSYLTWAHLKTGFAGDWYINLLLFYSLRKVSPTIVLNTTPYLGGILSL